MTLTLALEILTAALIAFTVISLVTLLGIVLNGLLDRKR